MAPLPAPEPFELLDTVEAVDARKIRFERNRIKLPMGVEATFGMIRHPGASLAVPITADGHVVLLRQYPVEPLQAVGPPPLVVEV